MKISQKLIFGSLMLGICATVGVAIAGNKTANQQVKADATVSYDLRSGFTAYQNDTIAWGTPWGAEAINTYEFTAAGQGVNLADADGKLPAFGSTAAGTEFEDTSLSLFTYPMFHNSSMTECNGYVNQYPLGWKMADDVADPTTVSAWPRGYCSADRHYLKFYYQYDSTHAGYHPGYNCGLAIYFTVPTSGSIYLKDTLSVINGNSDGTYFCAYRVPAANVTESSWNSQLHHGLFGGEPIYPTKGVNVTSDWNTWKKVAYGTDTSYTTENITVEAGDQIVWLYGPGASNGYDTTTFNPTVVYGTSPVNEARTFESNYVKAPGGTEIPYNTTTSGTACLDTSAGGSNYYTDAITAYDSLSSEAKVMFNTEAEFADARARLVAWGKANGVTVSFQSNGSMVREAHNGLLNFVSGDSGNTMIITIACVASGLAILGMLLAFKKHKANK